MAGSSRKTKAADDISSTSPTKRARNASPPGDSSSSTTVSDELKDSQGDANPTDSSPPSTTPENATDGAAVPSATESCHLDVPDYVPESIIPRLQRLRRFCEPNFNRYGISYIPAAATWRQIPGRTWCQYDNMLCLHDKPIVAWMVGVARFVQLRDTTKFSIGLQLLCEDDVAAAIANSYGRCSPEQQPKQANTLTYANKWIGSKNKAAGEHSFDEVYDAVEHELQGWDANHKISAERVKYSDILVVEVYVRRFRNKEHNIGPGWTHWGVAFDLLRIALLAEGPAAMNEPPPDSSALI